MAARRKRSEPSEPKLDGHLAAAEARRVRSRTVAQEDSVRAARRALLEGVGAEVAASFPGTTRLGGQVVAALYLAEAPLSMDVLCTELGRAKSNVFGNLRSLEAAGIVERRRAPGARHDEYALRGPYPDVIVGAYIARLRWVVADKRALSSRALELLGDATGREADALRRRLSDLSRKYDRFAELFDALLPGVDGPLDLEALLEAVPVSVLRAFGAVTRTAIGARIATRSRTRAAARVTPR